ncbi:MAG TPA: DUF167 domain-containing protein [Ktedonobacterales bacterium]|jgi:hypothetical protein
MPHATEPDPAASHPPLRVEGGRLLVPIRVTPRASRASLALEGDELRARLPAPPVAGAANAALLALLAERLGVPKRAITLVRGATARHKLIAITGLDAATFWRRALSASG